MATEMGGERSEPISVRDVLLSADHRIFGMHSGSTLPSRMTPRSQRRQPRCILIAGPNGAGKTTFARRYLPEGAGVVHFVNADLIAAGLSPLDPGLAAVRGGRLALREIDRMAVRCADFAFETTLSGLGHARRIRAWKRAGYRVEMVHLSLKSSRLALKRIAARVSEGGHDVPRSDVIRRFHRGWPNFERVYRPLADAWAVYDNSGREARLLETSDERTRKPELQFSWKVGRALRRAAKDARRTAYIYGVPICVWENGKVVALKPQGVR